MKLIQRKSLAAAKAILNKHGLVMSDAVVEEMLVAASDRPAVEYEVGDFVMYYEGMGEMYFGTVASRHGDDVWSSYQVKPYKHEHTMQVSNSDMRGVTTVKQADDYIRLRSVS